MFHGVKILSLAVLMSSSVSLMAMSPDDDPMSFTPNQKLYLILEGNRERGVKHVSGMLKQKFQDAIAAGADVNAHYKWDNGNTPLHVAIRALKQYIRPLDENYPVMLSIIEYLRNHGADPAARNNAGQTPRQMANALNEPTRSQVSSYLN
jgi:hypothetical protein